MPVPGAMFDPARPAPPRVYDYFLGGKDNYAADREAAAALEQVNPDARACAASSRAFLARAVAWAAGQGISQFLDLGAGYPAQSVTRDAAGDAARVLYVDSDPVVASHLQLLLRPGTGVLKADLRDAGAVTAAGGHAGIDLAQPVCVVFGAVLHLMDAADAAGTVAAYTTLLAADSAVIVSVWAACDDELASRIIAAYPGPLWRHLREDVAGWLAGLEIVPPGIGCARAWRPEGPVSLTVPPAYVIGAVARKR